MKINNIERDYIVHDENQILGFFGEFITYKDKNLYDIRRMIIQGIRKFHNFGEDSFPSKYDEFSDTSEQSTFEFIYPHDQFITAYAFICKRDKLIVNKISIYCNKSEEFIFEEYKNIDYNKIFNK